MKKDFLHQIVTKIGISLAIAMLAVTPFVANAASLTASGSGSTKNVGQSFNVSIAVNGSGLNVQAFQGNVSVSNLSVTSLSLGGAYLCTVNPTTANLNFACTVTGQAVPSATVYTMAVQGIAAGPASVSVSGIRVLDSSFADVYNGPATVTASYTIATQSSGGNNNPTPPTPPTAPTAPKAPSAPKAPTAPKVAVSTQSTDSAAVAPVTQESTKKVATSTGSVKGAASNNKPKNNSLFLGSTFLGIYNWIWFVVLLWLAIGGVIYYRRKHSSVS